MTRPDATEPAVRAEIAQAVSDYYTDKLRTFGVGPRGVDWKDAASQELRFAQLCRLLDGGGSVIDFGCGYGGFLHHVRRNGFTGAYLGIDLSADMIAAAQSHCAGLPDARVLCAAQPDTVADFAVASGIFNVRMGFDDDAWRAHMLAVLADMDRHSRRGFAFNCLTRYSDPGRMRADLYYADPLELFDHCKRTFARDVALLHDYGLYEFTMIVRKTPDVRP